MPTGAPSRPNAIDREFIFEGLIALTYYTNSTRLNSFVTFISYIKTKTITPPNSSCSEDCGDINEQSPTTAHDAVFVINGQATAATSAIMFTMVVICYLLSDSIMNTIRNLARIADNSVHDAKRAATVESTALVSFQSNNSRGGLVADSILLMPG